MKPVKAWGIVTDGRIRTLLPFDWFVITGVKKNAQDWKHSDERVVRVEIREVKRGKGKR